MEVEGARHVRFYQRERKQNQRRDAGVTQLTVSAWCTHPQAWVHTITSFHNITENSLLMEQTPAVS